MSDADLAVVATHAELVACLDRLYIRADSPSYRDLEQRTGRLSGSELPGTGLKRVRLGRSAIGELLRGSTFPKKAFLLTFVEACGVDIAADPQWAQAWDRLSEQYVKRAGQAQTELAELRAEVARLHAEVAAEQLTVDGLRAEEAGLRAEAVRLRAEMKAQAEKADRRAEEVRLRAEADMEKAQAEKADLRAQLATATKDAEKGRLEALDQLEQTQRKLTENQNEIARLYEKVRELTEELKAQERKAAHPGDLAPAAADSHDYRAVPGYSADVSGYGAPPQPPDSSSSSSGYGTPSGYADSGYAPSGYADSGYGQSGYGQSGYGQSGYGQPEFGSSPRPADAADPRKAAAPVPAAAASYEPPDSSSSYSGYGTPSGYADSGYGSGSGSDPHEDPGGRRKLPFGPEISWPYGFRSLDKESREALESAYGTGSVYQQPAQGDSGYGQPGYGQPGYGQPAYGEPAYGEPAYGSSPRQADADPEAPAAPRRRRRSLRAGKRPHGTP